VQVEAPAKLELSKVEMWGENKRLQTQVNVGAWLADIAMQLHPGQQDIGSSSEDACLGLC
jgi:hypothetical protein